MKKVKYLIISLMTLFVSLPNAYAASASMSVSSKSIYTGESFTVTVNVAASAAWNIHVTASGPVSGCTITQADASADAMDTNKQFTATCTSTGAGTITVSLSGDVTSATDGNPVNVSGSQSVTVSNKPSSGGSTTGGQTGGQTGGSSSNLSTNNKVKKISVEGYSLTKKDDKTYELSVNNSVESIDVKVEAEDEKAKVSNDGTHKLKVGENKIEVVVTSESGDKNTITLNVTRKENYTIEDIDESLKDGNTNIVIENKTEISEKDINVIKNSGETVYLTSYDENNKEEYSWILDGSKIEEAVAFDTKVTFNSSYKSNIDEITNYADGVYVNFSHHGDLPKNTKIRIYVGNKYLDGSLVNVYYYDESNNNITKVHENIEVKSGYVEFEIEHCSEYFVSMTKLAETTTVKPSKSSFNFFILTSAIELIILIVLIVYIIMGKKKVVTSNVSYEVPTVQQVAAPVVPEVIVAQTEQVYQEPVQEVQNNVDNTNNNMYN